MSIPVHHVHFQCENSSQQKIYIAQYMLLFFKYLAVKMILIIFISIIYRQKLTGEHFTPRVVDYIGLHFEIFLFSFVFNANFSCTVELIGFVWLHTLQNVAPPTILRRNSP